MDHVPEEEDNFVRMEVKESKNGDCEAGVVVLVSFDNLNEFLNNLSKKIEDGLDRLESERDKLAQE